LLFVAAHDSTRRSSDLKVGLEVYGILIDIYEQFLSDSFQSRFSISHRCSSVTVDRSEVSLTVYEWISQRPVLSHTDHCLIDSRVTVRVIFSQHFPDDPG